MNNNKYVNWLFISKVETKYWEIIKLWINVEEFSKWMEENKNNKWYINVDILESKNWKLYWKLNEFKKEEQENTKQEDEEDLPF